MFKEETKVINMINIELNIFCVECDRNQKKKKKVINNIWLIDDMVHGN